MPLRIHQFKNFEKDAAKFKNNAVQKEEIQSAIIQILDDPSIGKPLKGNLRGMVNFGFSKSPQLRIIYAYYECCQLQDQRPSDCQHEDVYEIEEDEVCEGIIDFLFVRTRESCTNLYRKNKKYFKKYIREL